MAPKAENKYPGDVIRYEAPAYYSRKNVTLATSQACKIGSLLEASGANWQICSTGANARKVSITKKTTTGATATITVVTRHAIVAYANIEWGALNAAGKLAAITALEAVGVVVESGPTYDEGIATGTGSGTGSGSGSGSGTGS